MMFLKVIFILSVSGVTYSSDSLGVSHQGMKRLHQLQKVKEKILDGLHLDSVPKLPKGRGGLKVHKALARLQEAAMSGQNPNLEYPESYAIILFSEPPKSTDDVNLLRFHISREGNSFPMEVKSASLYIRIRSLKREPRTLLRVSARPRRRRARQKRIKLLIQHHNRKRNRFRRVSLLKANIRKTKWFEIHIPTGIVQRDLNSANKTILLKIACKRCKHNVALDMLYRRYIRPGKSRRRKLSTTRPYLVVHTKSNTPTRPRRYLDDCTARNGSTSQCCTRPMHINFREIGWDDWILYPSGFMTSTCDGQCRAHVDPETELSRDRISTNDSTSCRPTDLESLALVYYRRANVLVSGTVTDLVEKNCACS